ncbi:MAG: hypothetical protein ACLQVM_13290 [Terriglobia bacterium]
MGRKQQGLKAIEELPDEAGVEDALDRHYLLYKVERSIHPAEPALWRGWSLNQMFSLAG